MVRRAGPLWAITSYFNPAGYRNRRKNYRAFREHLAVPLVTVEWARDGRFALVPEDAEVLVQVTGGDVLWQKERLLNVALRHLPDECDSVAWLDCDVIFDNEAWPVLASEALHHDAVVHLFEERHDLPRDADPGQLADWNQPPSATSYVYNLASGNATPDDLANNESVRKLKKTDGLAWAARRDLLTQHGFYDACILGSGDRAMICAMLGWFDSLVQVASMNSARMAHYRGWAEPFFDSVRGRMSYVPGRVFHLWHGDLRNRRYGERYRVPEFLDFDPGADIAIDKSGCWRWSSDKPALHEYVLNYFAQRREDGGER